MFNNFILNNIIPVAFKTDPMNFVGNLKYMLSGMVAIFIVIGVIIILTTILNKVFSKK